MDNLYSTTKMTSKGQIVIPEEIRLQMGFEVGTQFLVMGEKDVVILKTLNPPQMNEFNELIAKAETQARKAKIKKSDITKMIKKARQSK